MKNMKKLAMPVLLLGLLFLGHVAFAADNDHNWNGANNNWNRSNWSGQGDWHANNNWGDRDDSFGRFFPGNFRDRDDWNLGFGWNGLFPGGGFGTWRNMNIWSRFFPGGMLGGNWNWNRNFNNNWMWR